MKARIRHPRFVRLLLDAALGVIIAIVVVTITLVRLARS